MTTWSPRPIPLRKPGWESRFVAALEAQLATPFAWGVSDCLVVPAEICRAMTGVNPFPMRLRRYRTATGALRLLQGLGFADVRGPLEAAFKPVSKARARRGDCGVRMAGAGYSTFVVLGNGMAVGKGETGPVVVPVLSLETTYAVGWEP